MNHLKYLVANHSPFTAFNTNTNALSGDREAEAERERAMRRAVPKEQTLRWILIGTMNRCVQRKRDTAAAATKSTKVYTQ